MLLLKATILKCQIQARSKLKKRCYDLGSGKKDFFGHITPSNESKRKAMEEVSNSNYIEVDEPPLVVSSFGAIPKSDGGM